VFVLNDVSSAHTLGRYLRHCCIVLIRCWRLCCVLCVSVSKWNSYG